MKIFLLAFAFVLGSNWSYQAYLSYGQRYCQILDWDFVTLGFKIGCLLSGN